MVSTVETTCSHARGPPMARHRAIKTCTIKSRLASSTISTAKTAEMILLPLADKTSIVEALDERRSLNDASHYLTRGERGLMQSSFSITTLGLELYPLFITPPRTRWAHAARTDRLGKPLKPRRQFMKSGHEL